MRETERRARLVDHLRADGRASVAELAVDLGVTPSTIRRDLQRLAREGRLVRTYGGAALTPGARLRARRPHLDAKRAIAAPPRPRVADGSTIAIGSGTTALALAREIADRRLTVITNALDVANVLLDRDGIELIVLGGVVRPRMHSMLGPPRRARVAGAAGRHAVHGHRRDQRRAGPDERLGARDPHRPRAAPDVALGRRPRRRLEVRAGGARATCSGSTRSTSWSPTTATPARRSTRSGGGASRSRCAGDSASRPDAAADREPATAGAGR